MWHRQLCTNDVAILIFIAIQTEEAKVKKSIRDAAKKGQNDVCKILAKELVQSRKAVSKLYASKAHMNSVIMQMQNQLGKVIGTEYSMMCVYTVCTCIYTLYVCVCV